MHGYTDSLDSSVNIRTNPLNIHMDDGSDLVIGHPSPSQFVSTSKPEVFRAVSSQSQKAEPIYANDLANASLQSIHEPVQPLNIAKNKQQALDEAMGQSSLKPAFDLDESVKLDAPSSIAELSIPDFSPLITPDLDTFSLARQGTIKSKAPVETGPSKSAELFKRIRSIRTRQPDPVADEPLPANLLKVIQFTPDAEGGWRENFLSDTESLAPSLAVSPAISDATLGQNPKALDVGGSDNETKTESPEILNLAEIAEICEISEPEKPIEVKKEATQRSPNVSSPARDASLEPEELVIAQTPDITETDPITEDDRGRLFMQIRKLQSLRGLPIDPSRNPRFTITLDNGLQTVTTPPVPLPSPKYSGTIHAAIGQEFELTVGRDLELVMTLNLLMDSIQPPPKPRSLGSKREEDKEATTATEEVPITPKQSRVKSFFSPKKNKSKSKDTVSKQIKTHDDYVQVQKQHDAQMAEYRKRRDVWKGLTGPTGEYARGYLFESHYEREIYGKAEIYSLPLYNEWQGEDAQHMGDLELTLMFVPRLYGSEELPQSLTQAQKQIKAAQKERDFDCSGYLTQNGGDCGMYRRRYFTLNGTEFIAHHEASHKVRAVIHMENAIEVVGSENVTPNDNMWCIYEDRSFLLIFSDGEEVSFYADTPELKAQWVQALSKSMTFSSGKSRKWEDLVLDSFEAK